MSNREPNQHAGELAVNTLLPNLRRLEWETQSISERVHQFVPRKSLSETVKAQHRHVVASLGGRCCGFVILVDPEGRLLAGEYDHFYSRERNTFEDTWLICKGCHASMGKGPSTPTSSGRTSVERLRLRAVSYNYSKEEVS